MKKIKTLFKKFVWALKTLGFKKAFRMIFNWIFHPEMRKENRLNPRYRYDNVDKLLKKIDFSLNYERGDRSERISKEYIHISWIFSPFHIGSGGHQTLLRFIQSLSLKGGYKNIIYITDGHLFKSEKEAYEIIQEHFFEIPDLEVRFLTEDMLVDGSANIDPTDFVVATRYNTVYYAALIKNCLKRFYFVQDFEPMFFPVGYEYLFAENSYKLGFHGICASPWLAGKVKVYGMKADSFYLGYDSSIYFDKGLSREPNSVSFYARFESERRVVELGMLALEIVQQRVPDLKVYLYGSNDVLEGYDFNYQNLGVLNYDEISKLFNTTQVGVSFSMTNYSLTPTEMMASGLPVVELRGDNTESVFTNGENILLSEKNHSEVAESIIKMLNNKELRDSLRDGGYRFIEDKKWENIWNETEKIFPREITDFE
jgi:glycosyltransferase involved in cell wall biosynthesis